jgi:hypothetical protein
LALGTLYQDLIDPLKSDAFVRVTAFDTGDGRLHCGFYNGVRLGGFFAAAAESQYHNKKTKNGFHCRSAFHYQ